MKNIKTILKTNILWKLILITLGIAFINFNMNCMDYEDSYKREPESFLKEKSPSFLDSLRNKKICLLCITEESPNKEGSNFDKYTKQFKNELIAEMNQPQAAIERGKQQQASASILDPTIKRIVLGATEDLIPSGDTAIGIINEKAQEWEIILIAEGKQGELISRITTQLSNENKKNIHSIILFNPWVYKYDKKAWIPSAILFPFDLKCLKHKLYNFYSKYNSTWRWRKIQGQFVLDKDIVRINSVNILCKYMEEDQQLKDNKVLPFPDKTTSFTSYEIFFKNIMSIINEADNFKINNDLGAIFFENDLPTLCVREDRSVKITTKGQSRGQLSNLLLKNSIENWEWPIDNVRKDIVRQTMEQNNKEQNLERLFTEEEKEEESFGSELRKEVAPLPYSDISRSPFFQQEEKPKEQQEEEKQVPRLTGQKMPDNPIDQDIAQLQKQGLEQKKHKEKEVEEVVKQKKARFYENIDSFYNKVSGNEIISDRNISAISYKQIIKGLTIHNSIVEYIRKTKSEITTLKNNQSFMQKIIIENNSEIGIIGDIHGSIHSLIKILKNLKDKNYIDNNFKIVKNNFYMVFTGDYVDRGIYGAEVWYTILQLKLKNWDKVYLLRGNHETITMTAKYGFQKEINYKYIPSWALSINNAFDQLYTYLPMALYVGSQGQDKINWVQFCHGGAPMGTSDLDRTIIPTFIDNKKANFTILNFKQPKEKLKSGFMWSDFIEQKNQLYMRKYNRFVREGQLTQDLAERLGNEILINRDFLDEINIKAFFRGHQHSGAGLKIFTKNSVDPVSWEKAINLDDYRNGAFPIYKYPPVFTFTTATEFKLSNDVFYGILKTAKEYEEWMLEPVLVERLDD